MYRIKCDDFTIYDPMEDNLLVGNAKCALEVNTVGTASFDIYPGHSHYSLMEKLKSVFEILDDNTVIFRGRMTDDSEDYYTRKTVKLEGALAYANDSMVRPFSFPEDFQKDEDYKKAEASGNVVAFFLGWLIKNHNFQVREFQKLKLGTVTVTDPNNFITRSSESRLSTWEVLRSKLFGSELGGYLCIRYEKDGNYVDYVDDFELTNPQDITLDENILDFNRSTDATTTYTAVIPLGKTPTEEGEEGSAGGEELTIESYQDGDIDGDLVKTGDTIYSKSGVEKYGWIYAPVADTTWEDVTMVRNLVEKAREYLSGSAVKMANSIAIKAVDLHYSDAQIQSFRVGRYVNVYSEPHGLNQRYKLTKLSIDISNPQNTVIEVGDKILTLTEHEEDLAGKIEKIESDYQINQSNTDKRIENIEKQLRLELSSNHGIYQRKKAAGGVDPDYTKDPLVITPTVYFKNAIQKENLEFVWKRKTGSEEEALTPGETDQAGMLSVSRNLEDQVRYICYVTYTTESGKAYVANAWQDYAVIADGAAGAPGPQGKPGTDGKDAAVISDKEPADKTMLWCDTSLNPPQIKQWNGKTWIIVNDPVVLEEKIYKEVDSKIQQESGKISMEVNEKITTVRGEISNIQVGGRNLILGTAEPLEKTTTSDSTNVNVVMGNFSQYFFDERKEGKVITLSFDWETTGTSGTIIPQFYGTPWSGFSESKITVSSTNQSGRYEFTKKLKANEVDGTTTYPSLCFRIDGIDGTTTFRNIKCEFGNKATDWSIAPEDMDENFENVRNSITQSHNDAVDQAGENMEEALKDYVNNDTYNKFVKETGSNFEQTESRITSSFTEKITELKKVDGEIKESVSLYGKYFHETKDGLEIVEEVDGVRSALSLHIDNDMIQFRKNGNPVGWWDGTDFHTGNIVVEVQEKAQFGNFAFVPRSDGSLSLLKVGD